MNALIAILIACLYGYSSLLQWRVLRDNSAKTQTLVQQAFLPTVVAVILHSILASRQLLLTWPYKMDLISSLSLVSCLMVAMMLLLSLIKKPMANLGAIVLPPASFLVILNEFAADTALNNLSNGVAAHVFLAMFAYSMLALAAAQAIFLATQIKRLKSHHPEAYLRVLAPVDELEQVLFMLVGIAFALLSAALFSGWVSLDNMHEQQVAHKMLLTALSWVILGALLLGRLVAGWRGMLAVKLTLSSMLLCLVGYFGSKFIIEHLLG